MEVVFVTEPQHEPAESHPTPAEGRARPCGVKDSMILLAYAALRDGFDGWRTHQPELGRLPSAEAIHQMRISTRRLRVALRLFEQLLPSGTRTQLNGELRWFGRALGDARDLDVYTESFAQYARAAGLGQRSLAQFEFALERARDAARENLQAVFASERRLALARTLQTLAAGPGAGALRRWRSFLIVDGAGEYLEAARRRIVKRGRRLREADPPERLHALRIAAKRFRYEVEVFVELYPRLHPTAKAAKRLQDVLGEFQDACTAIDRLRGLLRSGELQAAHGEVEAVEQLLAGQHRRAESVRRAVPGVWRAFEKATTRSAIAKAVSA